MSTPTPKRLVEREIEVWNTGDVDAIDDIYADDAVYVDAYGERHDVASFKQYIERLRSAFPDFHVEIEAVVAEGDHVATRYTFGGTHEGEYRGFEPTGNSFELHGMTFGQVEDGRFVEMWNATNVHAMATQLELLG
jgi:steroid delta-isomerase-like uncharacterized protein